MLSNSFVKTLVDLRSRKDSILSGKPGKIQFSPTRFGWLFVVVLLGLLMGSINYNNNLGFLFLQTTQLLVPSKCNL